MSQMPLIPLLADIKGMPLAQLQAYCRAYELPCGPSVSGGAASGNNQNIKMADMRTSLEAVRFIAQGDVGKLTADERLALFDGWGLEGDYTFVTPDQVLLPLVGYWHAMVMRYQATGYCRTPCTVADNGSAVITNTGSGTIPIAVTITGPSS